MGGSAHIIEGTAATQKDLKHRRGTFMSQRNLYEIPQELVQSPALGKEARLAMTRAGERQGGEQLS